MYINDREETKQKIIANENFSCIKFIISNYTQFGLFFIIYHIL